MIGTTEILIILIIILVLFGPKRLPKLARAIGEAVREYRKAVEGEEKKVKSDKEKKKLAG